MNNGSLAYASSQVQPGIQARAVVVVVCLMALWGCTSAPVEKVVLLPGHNGAPTGAVEVRAAKVATLLDEPWAQASIAADGTVKKELTNEEEVRRRYGPLMTSLPAYPRTWTVYFDTGSDRLVPQSQGVLAEVRESFAASAAAELILIGHTDRVGSLEDNDRLSLQRATALKAQLTSSGFDGQRIQVVGRGERQPLVPTADEVAEPRNRRVEVKLR